MIKFSRDINIVNEFRISKFEVFVAYMIGISIFYVNFILLFIDETVAMWLKILFGVVMVVWTCLCIMLYCEKTKPLLAIPVDIDDELIYSGMTEYSDPKTGKRTASDKIIEDAEEQSQLSSNVDFMDFQPKPVKLDLNMQAPNF